MREMKDSGIEWIGEIPKHWKIKKPKYIGSIRSGDSVTNKKLNDDIGYEVLGGNGTIGFYDKYNVDGTHIIIGRVGALCGNSRITRGKKFISDNALIYTCFEGQAENYINYIFDAFNLNKLNTSNAQPLITGSKVLNIFIPYPYIIEQKIIADFLDSKCSEIDATAEDIQKEISLLEEYKKSVITEAVTKGLNPDAEMKDSGIEWIGDINPKASLCRLKFFSYMKGRIGWQGLKSEDFIDNGPYCVTGTDFINGKINWDTCYHVSEERYKMDSNIQLKIGDLLVTKDGTIGKLAKVTELPEKACLNSHLLIIRPLNERFTNEYLYYVISSDVFVRYYKYSSTGSTIESLSQDKLGNFIFPVYDLLSQQQIVDYLDTKCSEIDSLIDDKKRQLDILADYKKSLIYEYVTGKKEVPVNE